MAENIYDSEIYSDLNSSLPEILTKLYNNTYVHSSFLLQKNKKWGNKSNFRLSKDLVVEKMSAAISAQAYSMGKNIDRWIVAQEAREDKFINELYNAVREKRGRKAKNPKSLSADQKLIVIQNYIYKFRTNSFFDILNSIRNRAYEIADKDSKILSAEETERYISIEFDNLVGDIFTKYKVEYNRQNKKYVTAKFKESLVEVRRTMTNKAKASTLNNSKIYYVSMNAEKELYVTLNEYLKESAEAIANLFTSRDFFIKMLVFGMKDAKALIMNDELIKYFGTTFSKVGTSQDTYNKIANKKSSTKLDVSGLFSKVKSEDSFYKTVDTTFTSETLSSEIKKYFFYILINGMLDPESAYLGLDELIKSYIFVDGAMDSFIGVDNLSLNFIDLKSLPIFTFDKKNRLQRVSGSLKNIRAKIKSIEAAPNLASYNTYIKSFKIMGRTNRIKASSLISLNDSKQNVVKRFAQNVVYDDIASDAVVVKYMEDIYRQYQTKTKIKASFNYARMKKK